MQILAAIVSLGSATGDTTSNKNQNLEIIITELENTNYNQEIRLTNSITHRPYPLKKVRYLILKIFKLKD